VGLRLLLNVVVTNASACVVDALVIQALKYMIASLVGVSTHMLCRSSCLLRDAWRCRHLSSRQHRVQVAYTITEVSLALASAFEDTSSKADVIHVAMNNIVGIFAIDLDYDLQRLSSWLILSILFQGEEVVDTSSNVLPRVLFCVHEGFEEERK
jgi:hypothetical protein